MVHIQTRNDDLLHAYPFLQTYLTLGEVESIKRLVKQHDRNIKLVSRITLKYLLSRKMGRAIEEVEIQYNPFGKPYVNHSSIEFNLSHSGNIILIGFDNRAIGVDIEEMRPIDNGTARFFMSEIEYKHFKTLLDEQSRINFYYQIWTAKESLLKATGMGITNHINQIEIPFFDTEKGLVFENHLYFLLQGKVCPEYMYSLCTKQSERRALVTELKWIEMFRDINITI